MATTGFWPVKNRLKEVLAYADNPDKTIDPKYLDKDLWQALQYAADDAKTDDCIYVSALNCPKQTAYESMMATKRRFGKLGGNVAYHAYQSFPEGEVTAEEALEIGMESAKRMWGDKYEVLIAVHRNTDNLHCHFVINSVSFKTGEKFKNKIADHRRFREISDAVCLEYGKSVLKDAPFRGGDKGAYWVHKNGGNTHRDILRKDLEWCLREAYSPKDLERRLNAIGYVCDFNQRHEHWTVRAVDWERPVRIDKLGYTKNRLNAELDGHKLWGHSFNAVGFYLAEHPIYKPPVYPVRKQIKEWEYELDHTKDPAEAIALLIVLLFAIFMEMIRLSAESDDYMPRTPGLRKLITEAPKIEQEYRLLIDNRISSMQELFDYHDSLEKQIMALESDRQKIRNKLRRCKNENERAALKQQAKDVTKQLNPLREQNRITDRIEHRAPDLQRMMVLERELEIQSLTRQRNQRNEERSR